MIKQPKLRFTGFNDAWEQCKLGEISDIVRGASPRPINDKKWFDENSNIGWLRISDVTNQEGRIRYLSQKLSILGQAKTRILMEPHLILSIAATVGKPVINYIHTGVHDGFLVFMNPKFNCEFMFWWLEMYRPRWKNYGQSGSQVNINSELVKNTELSLPNETEQAKIGSFFEQLDNLITLHQRKVELLEQQKKAFLHKMFPKGKEFVPNIRFATFCEQWKIFSLKQLLIEFSEKSKIENQFEILSSTNAGIEKRNGKVSGLTNKGYKILKKDNLVLSPQNLWLGNININNFQDGLVSPSYKTFILSDHAIPDFLNPQLKTRKMLEYYKNASHQGASIVRRNLELELFYQITLLCPTVTEQGQVGCFFRKLDNSTTLYHQKISTLLSLKKSLLRKLFI